MSLRNKIKNFQMFGFLSLSPKTYKKLFLGVFLIALFIFIGKSYMDKDSEKITGGTIINTAADTLQKPAQETTPEITQEQEPIEQANETPKYYEYGGQCSYDIEKAEDDVSDILNYMQQDEEKYKSLKEEYDRKLQELKEHYEYNIGSAKEQTDYNQKALEEAQANLNNLHEVCAF